MSVLQKIQSYISQTTIKNSKRYGMNMSELLAMRETAGDDLSSALCLAFDYGMAKGYRAAKKEAQA